MIGAFRLPDGRIQIPLSVGGLDAALIGDSTAIIAPGNPAYADWDDYLADDEPEVAKAAGDARGHHGAQDHRKTDDPGLEKKFNPLQPRDWHGRWGGRGGSATPPGRGRVNTIDHPAPAPWEISKGRPPLVGLPAAPLTEAVDALEMLYLHLLDESNPTGGFDPNEDRDTFSPRTVRRLTSTGLAAHTTGGELAITEAGRAYLDRPPAGLKQRLGMEKAAAGDALGGARPPEGGWEGFAAQDVLAPRLSPAVSQGANRLIDPPSVAAALHSRFPAGSTADRPALVAQIREIIGEHARLGVLAPALTEVYRTGWEAGAFTAQRAVTRLDPGLDKADKHPGDGNAERLREYWATGEGAAKIRWGEPGDFDRCVDHTGRHLPPGEVKGYCARLHHRVLGVWPGQEHGADLTLREGM